MILEDKVKQATMVEVAYNDAQMEVVNLQNNVAIANSKLTSLEKEEAKISQQLLQMQKGGDMSLWPKPILHRDRPQGDNPNMIIIKKCGICGQWYHCFDVAMTSCLHTYHPTCLGEHPKTNKKCKVCNQILHPNWWSSWGFTDLDQYLILLAQKMGIKEEHV
jgi:hypothetical protein